VNFCRFWQMTPREVDDLYPDEYDAMTRHAVAAQAADRRAARKRKG
jgi:hypothetical protein